MMKKTELLAPAGDMLCLKAAVNAGADAVYLGGKEFGARAFAGNFEKEELLLALDYVHLLGKKIYLTFNTLIKENEYESILPFLTPFYQNGLDGIIIQDIGLIPFFKRNFPLLELHISTQMTVTNYRSAKFLFDQGISRIVPARELSLIEIQEIKKTVPIEIEAFVHGAMCYCYSGQCLFSSFLGGRSGNRGRCAQPCRLPYQIQKNSKDLQKKEIYPLSLKDLNTIELIPEMIEAGIDSFKIEGRMKSAEYVYGVTSIYRKAIDAYEAGQSFQLSAANRHVLESLYIRSGVETGYYKRHNGKEMITLFSPSYAKNDDQVIETIKKENAIEKKISLLATADFEIGKKASLRVSTATTSFTAMGSVVEQSVSHPITEEQIKKQLQKTGNSFFTFDNIAIHLDSNCFFSLKELNELRRNALSGIQEVLLRDTFRTLPQNEMEHIAPQTTLPLKKQCFFVSIMNIAQLKTALYYQPDGIYIPADLFYDRQITAEELERIRKESSSSFYLSLPRIIRKKDDAYLEWLKTFLLDHSFDGVLIKNLDELELLLEIHYQGEKICDHNLYIWNKNSYSFLKAFSDFYTAPLELNHHDLSVLSHDDMELIIYGHMPLMVSANCIKKTENSCHDNSVYTLKDRYAKELPVYCNCIHCYNEIFNAVALSLHKEFSKYTHDGIRRFRLSFTNETPAMMDKILSYYLTSNEPVKEFPLKEYTTGHSAKGAL